MWVTSVFSQYQVYQRRPKMSDTIKTFLEDGKLKTSLVTVKLIKQISIDSYIIADKSMVAILDLHEAPTHAKYIQAGSWYKLIKCQKGGQNSIKINKIFKPVKTQVKEDLGDISEEVGRVEQYIGDTASSKQYINFETIKSLPNHTKIDKLSIKVITKSRVINTNKGNYQICNIKDAKGDTTSINLYSKHLNQLELFKIYTITNLRKGEVTKNEETNMRLHTTGFTKIEDGNMEDSVNFQSVGNGDGSISGVVIGFGDITFYQSCKRHYSKLDDDLKCPKCNLELKSEETLEDFRSELYIEGKIEDSPNDETEVKEITFFKKALDKSQDYTQDDIENQLNGLTGKTAKIDYNTDDADRLIAVSIQLT